MKLTILQGKLKEALTVVEKIASKSPSLPILGNVLLEVKESFLKLSSTNLETGINYWLLSKVEREGRITVPASILSNFVNYLPSSNLEMEAKQGILHLESKDVKTKINGLDAEEFPIIPQIEKVEKATMSSLTFGQGLAQVVSIASLSSIRPEISGVYCLFDKNSLTLAATDSFRLGEKKISFKKPLEISNAYSLILPAKTASLSLSVFGDKDVPLDIYFSPNLLMLETKMEETTHPKIQLVSKLIDGAYPKYQEIIPQEYKAELVASKKEFLTRLKAASLFASRINEVKIGLDSKNQKATVFCQNAELGEYVSSFPAEIKGEDSEVSFNYKFLLDGFSNIRGEKVFFALSKNRDGEDGPAVMKSTEDSSYLYVVMPIQAA